MKTFDHKNGTYLRIDDAKIYYEIIGVKAGPTLLILHGGFGTIEDFNDITAELAQTYQILGIDSRGHGKSTLGSKPLSYELLEKDVEAILHHLGIDTLSILGFSDGGIVGYRLAALTNLKIECLITIGATWHTKNLDPLRAVFAKITGDSWKARFPAHFESYQALNPEPDFNLLTESLITMWLDTKSSGHPDERISTLSCPSLILRGENDPLVSAADIDELAQLIAQAEVVNIPKAGHEAHKEDLNLVLAKLKSFLKH